MTLLPLWPTPRKDRGMKACSFHVPEVPSEVDRNKVKTYVVPFFEGVGDFLHILGQVAQLFRAKGMEDDCARKLSFLPLLLVGKGVM